MSRPEQLCSLWSGGGWNPDRTTYGEVLHNRCYVGWSLMGEPIRGDGCTWGGLNIINNISQAVLFQHDIESILALTNFGPKHAIWWHRFGSTLTQIMACMTACWTASHTTQSVFIYQRENPDSKVHGPNMGPIWGRQDPGGLHVGPMILAIWVSIIVH